MSPRSARADLAPSASQARLNAVIADIAGCAVRCLLLELATWPKPGLVSHLDTGSHDDMDARLFRASAAAIAPYLVELCEAGARGAEMAALRVVGLQAEAAMLAATGGVNTHRGAIFGMGLLCAAAGARAARLVPLHTPLGVIVSQRWGRAILDGPVLLHSHGSKARMRYGAGGARAEAAHGFPSVYEVGLPALSAARLKQPQDPEAARVEACFALIAAVEDTNLLHRGGSCGLRFAQHEARTFLDEGGVSDAHWRRRAAVIHRRFVARRLSPGGAADLLALTLFVDAQERHRSW